MIGVLTHLIDVVFSWPIFVLVAIWLLARLVAGLVIAMRVLDAIE